MANSSHKRDANARKLPKSVLVSAPIATLATLGVVGIGVTVAAPENSAFVASQSTSITDVTLDRETEVSRDMRRETPNEKAAARDAILDRQRAYDREQARLAALREQRATERAVKNADTKLWTTEELNLWTVSDASAKQVGVLDAVKRVLVTGREADGRTEIVLDGASRWVTSGYLDDEKPVAASGGLTMDPCPDSSVESGLTDGAVYVYRSVCHNFPQITSYGGWDAHGEHASGKAIDIMTSDTELGNAIAEFLQAHAAELHLYDIIWQQQIWTPERSSEGWRYMSDRGSSTANHYDHVHVSVY